MRFLVHCGDAASLLSSWWSSTSFFVPLFVFLVWLYIAGLFLMSALILGVSGGLGIVTGLHLLKKTKTDKTFIGSEINDWILWMNRITLWWWWGTVNKHSLTFRRPHGHLKGRCAFGCPFNGVIIHKWQPPPPYPEKTAFGYIEKLWGRAELQTYPSPLSPAEHTRWGFRGSWFVGWMPLAVFLNDWTSWSQSPGIN